MSPTTHLLLSIGGTFVVIALGVIAYVATQALPLLRRLLRDVQGVRARLDEAAADKGVTPRR